MLFLALIVEEKQGGSKNREGLMNCLFEKEGFIKEGWCLFERQELNIGFTVLDIGQWKKPKHMIAESFHGDILKINAYFQSSNLPSNQLQHSFI